MKPFQGAITLSYQPRATELPLADGWSPFGLPALRLRLRLSDTPALAMTHIYPLPEWQKLVKDLS